MADDIPIIKRATSTPLQQRIRAVNEDGTLSFALHGEINRLIGGLSTTINYNADTIQLIVDTLAKYNILVQRVENVEKSQQDAMAEQALVNSYTDPTSVLSATTTTEGVSSIVVANHARVYADPAKTRVTVTGKTFPGLLPATYYFFYYDDAARAGGAVDIKITTNNLNAAQTGVRHSLGGIFTPAANEPPVSGGGTTPPGGGGYDPRRPRPSDL